MSILRAAREEVAGAARSLRYDLTLVRPTTRRALPGRDGTDRLALPDRRVRRLPAAAGVGALVLAGAAGTYFAVLTGLGALIDNATPVAPVARGAMPVDGPGHFAAAEPADHAAGHAGAARSGRVAAPPTAAPVFPLPTVAAGRPEATTAGEVPVPTPAPSCVCEVLPVPTPSAPGPTVTATPTDAPSPTPSNSPTATPSAGPTATPSASRPAGEVSPTPTY